MFLLKKNSQYLACALSVTAYDEQAERLVGSCKLLLQQLAPARNGLLDPGSIAVIHRESGRGERREISIVILILYASRGAAESL